MNDLQTKYTNVLNDIEKLQTIENHIWKSSTNSDVNSVNALKDIVEAKTAKYKELKLFENQSLFETASSNTTFLEAFKFMDNNIASYIKNN